MNIDVYNYLLKNIPKDTYFPLYNSYFDEIIQVRFYKSNLSNCVFEKIHKTQRGIGGDIYTMEKLYFSNETNIFINKLLFKKILSKI